MPPHAKAPSVSIIICTCNRSSELRETLSSLRVITIPEGWMVELVIVDNASSDDTRQVVMDAMPGSIPLMYVYEPRKGKSNALNSGLAHASGDVLLFTDDDVRPEVDWLIQLAKPLLDHSADAVQGSIQLASHLLRPWLTPSYAAWLAVCESPSKQPPELIGANMGIGRHVLEKVPGFDPELGPGAAGLAEDTLFGWQLVLAGYVIRFVAEAKVTHHPSSDRLLRAGWLKIAQSHGRKDAYLLHHWDHGRIVFPKLKSLWVRSKLKLRRLLSPPGAMNREGCSRWEMSYIGDIELYRAYEAEKTRARNYAKHGLTRLRPA